MSSSDDRAQQIEIGRTLAASGKYAPRRPRREQHRNCVDPDDDPGPSEPTDDEPTTWQPVALGPWLRGEIQQPQPTMGIRRTDGLRLIYAGREHAVLGETESGKTWFADGCVAAELVEGHPVVYVHYEEADPGSTIERLQLLGVDDDAIQTGLRFYGPAKAPRVEWIQQITALRPALVVHDGVNAAMAMIGADVMAVDGAALFRRQLVAPFTRTGAAVLACDHLPMVRDTHRRDAYGSVHKGNALDGARILLENTAPFGRGMRGVSHVYVTKDRPGYLRSHGGPSKTPGKTYVGTLVVDAATDTPDYLAFYAPRDNTSPAQIGLAQPADIVYDVLAAQPAHSVPSLRTLFAEVRKAGHQLRQAKIRDALDDLIADQRATETPGKRGATGYQATPPTVAQQPAPRPSPQPSP